MLTVGSLFSGAGLLDYGLEQAGMKTIWQVEYDDWCREVALPQNFPMTEKFKDVREVGKHNLKPVDCIAGGFPCPDISQATQNGKGLDGERSGLWREQFRIIREFLPGYALVENVARLAVFGLDRILSDFASIGYDAEWITLSSENFGLPTPRKRLFIVAYPQSDRLEATSVFKGILYKTGTPEQISARQTGSYLKDIGRSVVEIPEYLRMDNGITYELPEIKRVLQSYGNGVAVPVAKWIGEQIIRFDKEINGL